MATYTAKELIENRRRRWEKHHDIEDDADYRRAIAEHIVSEEAAELRRELTSNPENIIELFFVVVDKEQNTVPFFLNDVQRDFVTDLNQAKADYRAGLRLHLKFLVLKGRQQGFTSFITAYQLACSILSRNFSGYTIADDQENATTIFEDKAKFPYGQLPEAVKPTEKYNTRQELHFEKINSRWRVATAGKKEVGRSKTINFFHGSESAFWDSISKVIKGLGQALTKDSIQILETTANGYNEYQGLWDDATQGKNNWEPKFYEWWRTPEYRLNFENTFKAAEFKKLVQEDPGPIFVRCKWLLEEKGLDWSQLYWYYNKWKDLKSNTDSKNANLPLGDLPQEFPCTPDEAFLASGTPVFDLEKVMQRKNYLLRLYEKQKPVRGNFIYDYQNEKIVDSSIKFVPDPAGCFNPERQSML